MSNNKEKLIDFQAPQGSLVLTPSMGRKGALKMFYEWYNTVNSWQSIGHENISDSEDWKDIKLKYESDFQPITKDINKIEIINLKKDNNV